MSRDEGFSIKDMPVCPRCGGRLVINEGGIFCHEADACGWRMWRNISGKRLGDGDLMTLVSKGRTGVIDGFRKRTDTGKCDGAKYSAALVLGSDKETLTFDFDAAPKACCPVCSAAMKRVPDGYWCPGCRRTVFRSVAGTRLSDSRIVQILHDGVSDGKVPGLKTAEGRTYAGVLEFDKFSYAIRYRKGDARHSGLVEGGRVHACSCGGETEEHVSYHRCTKCGSTVWKTAFGHEFSYDEVEALFRDGQTPVIYGLVSKSGKPFAARLVLDEEDAIRPVFIDQVDEKTLFEAYKDWEDSSEKTKDGRRALPKLVAILSSHYGKEHAVTNERIRRCFQNRYGLDVKDAQLCEMVNILRVNHLIPFLAAGDKGYYICSGPDEMREYLRSLNGRINKQVQMFNALSEDYELVVSGKRERYDEI